MDVEVWSFWMKNLAVFYSNFLPFQQKDTQAMQSSNDRYDAKIGIQLQLSVPIWVCIISKIFV